MKDPYLCTADPQGHDIKLNTFKASVVLNFMIILQNLTTTNNRKSGGSKYDLKLTDLDVVTTRILYRVREASHIDFVHENRRMDVLLETPTPPPSEASRTFIDSAEASEAYLSSRLKG